MGQESAGVQAFDSILAIDPGTTQSGWCVLRHGRIFGAGVMPNDEMRGWVHGNEFSVDALAIEMVASYGMAVGAEVFRTVWWAGRFADAWYTSPRTTGDAIEVFRRDVKLHLCQSPRAKDGNVRQALIDRFGPRGTKKQPGGTYGVSSHAWAALAVAATAWDTRR